MGYYSHTVEPVGFFVEKDHGNHFEWSVNDDSMALCEDFDLTFLRTHMDIIQVSDCLIECFCQFRIDVHMSVLLLIDIVYYTGFLPKSQAFSQLFLNFSFIT